MTPTRVAAARALLALEARPTTLATEIERVRGDVPDERDRALLVEIATGCCRWRNELDFAIAKASRRAIETIEPPIRVVLRVGAYQLRHLDRIPDHAIVHESVETVRALGAARGAGFVNAVLRRLVREGARIAMPPRPGKRASVAAQLAYLTTTLSHPGWLVARWLERYGFGKTEAWCLFNNRVPEVTVRVIRDRDRPAVVAALREAGVDVEPGAWVADAIRLPPGALGRLPADARAALYVQDEASQIVARVVGATPGARVLDVCASPGGKTLILAADMAGQGHVAAGDFRVSRVRLLAETVRHAGAMVSVFAADARAPLPFGPVFDRVLIDAPCSGLGILRRDPDLKWARREEQLPGFAADQRRLLANAAEAVRPGGAVIYATCSSEPDENDAVVDAFLEERPEFAVRRADGGARVPKGSALVDSGGRLRTLPFAHELDAFFAAVLVRRQGA